MRENVSKPVRRCVCANVTFAELKKNQVRSVEDAQQRFGVASQCQSCRPYIERMLETGETEFDVFK